MLAVLTNLPAERGQRYNRPMAAHRVAAHAYGYAVCFGALVLFGYALFTLLPPSGPFAGGLEPVEVSVLATDTIVTDTMATDTMATDTMATDTVEYAGDTTEGRSQRSAHELLASIRQEEARQTLESLRASKQSFDDAKVKLEAERKRYRSLGIGLRFVQRGLLMLFAASVFVFHWRWLRSFAEPAA